MEPVTEANIGGINFVGKTGASVSGRIYDNRGIAISGVTVTRSGVGSTTVTTNSAGYYTFNGVPDGNVTLTPGKSGIRPSSLAG